MEGRNQKGRVASWRGSRRSMVMMYLLGIRGKVLMKVKAPVRNLARRR